MRDEAVVGSPRVQMLSLIAIGTPSNGSPGASGPRPSISAARSRARSAATWVKARTAPSRAAMRSMNSAHTSTAVAPSRSAARTSAMVLSADSSISR